MFLKSLWPSGLIQASNGSLTCATGGWIAVTTADGKGLAWREGNSEPDWLPAILEEGLQAWNKLPESERLPRALKLDDSQLDPKAFPRAPEGGMVLAAYVRALHGDPEGRYSRISQEQLLREAATFPGWDVDNTRPKMDVVWLTEREWKSLLPGTLRQGHRFPMSEVVRRRLIRHHFVDLTPNNPVRSWDVEDIRAEEIALIVEETAPVIRMRVEGRVRLESGADKDRFANGGVIDLGEGKMLAARSKSYNARIQGHLEFDESKVAFTRFDLLAIGDYCGSQEEAVLKSRRGSQPLGVAITLADGWERAVLWPSVMDDNWKNYCDSE